MITDALISLPIAVLTYLIGLLPAYSGLPTWLDDGLDFILGFIAQLGDILPTDTIWSVILATITLELGILAFNTIAWLLHWRQPK